MPKLTIDQRPDAIIVRRGKREVLRYNTVAVKPPTEIGDQYMRGAFIHPVRTPSGRIVTDDYPPDHAHQNGLFLAYTKTAFEGRQPNFWETPAGTGAIRFVKLLSKTEGPKFSEFSVQQQFVDLSAPDGKERPALDETWRVRVWNPGQAETKFWLIDIRSTLTCATTGSVNFPRYHYGGMALRGARDWKLDHCQFTTSAGRHRLEGNHTRPQWCDLAGDVDGRTAGIAQMTHPDNFRYPEPLRIHPHMPYMVYSPSHLGAWSIEPGQPHVSQYRFVVHDGDLTADLANQLWNDFASRPAEDSESGVEVKR